MIDCESDKIFILKFSALAKMDLDESKPVTTVSMRLADGSRLSGRFNWTHSVADLRLFIIT